MIRRPFAELSVSKFTLLYNTLIQPHREHAVQACSPNWVFKINSAVGDVGKWYPPPPIQNKDYKDTPKKTRVGRSLIGAFHMLTKWSDIDPVSSLFIKCGQTWEVSRLTRISNVTAPSIVQATTGLDVKRFVSRGPAIYILPLPPY